jgi:hypothetical protein
MYSPSFGTNAYTIGSWRISARIRSGRRRCGRTGRRPARRGVRPHARPDADPDNPTGDGIPGDFDLDITVSGGATFGEDAATNARCGRPMSQFGTPAYAAS